MKLKFVDIQELHKIWLELDSFKDTCVEFGLLLNNKLWHKTYDDILDMQHMIDAKLSEEHCKYLLEKIKGVDK